MKKYLIQIILIAVITAGLGFFGGMKYQQGQRSTGRGQLGGFNRQGAPGGNNFRPVSGEIIQVSDKSVTVKLPDGSSKIVVLSDSTKINKSSAGQKSDLTSGIQVTVFGAANSDGSVTAQNIQMM